VKFLKVSSADLTNIPLLRAIGKTGLPVIISTGGGTIPEVKQALAAIGHGNVAILHCVATYPTEPQECNLRAITTLRAEFPDHIIGLSDHFNGILPSLMAGMYGAGIIEKHFKGDMEPKGGDARFSLDNHKMKDLTDSLKNMMVMSGTGAKFKNSKESEALRKMGKGIYAARKILKGEPVTENDIALKSPADGIPAWAWDAVLQKRNALCDIEEETPLDWRMLDGDLTISVAPSTIDTKGIL
jgi:sialic acid synthase